MATIEDYRWLVSGVAEAWLTVACQESLGRGASVSLVEKLRRDLSLARSHLVAEQIELRERASEKFSNADRMFFTRQGLEQATDENLAAHKASRFVAGSTLADLCCGIGGDLLGLAGRGPATGIDVDEVAAVIAAANLAALGSASSDWQFDVADAATAAVEDFAAWHCDPDRRTGGRRTTLVERFSPGLEELGRLVERNASAAIKLAPATIAPREWAEQAELEWLGSRGECRQQVTWLGALARHPGKRTATLVEGETTRTVVGTGQEAAEVAASIGAYVFEPQACVLAAKLGPALCQEYGLSLVHGSVAYLTGDRPVCDVALDVFEVQDVLPLDRKKLRAYCRERQLGRLEIKKRGVDVDPALLRRELTGDGDGEATIIVTPVGDRVRAIVARRTLSEVRSTKDEG